MQPNTAAPRGILRTAFAAVCPAREADAAAADDADTPRLAAYKRALQAHDWEHDQSADQRVWRRGREERAALMLEAAAIDADFAVWDSIAPAAHRRGEPA